MQLNDWKNKGKYIDYKGHQIFYVQEGQAEEHLVLIHGFPTSSWDWYKIWQPLVDRFTVTAPDMIGFGYSAKPKKYYYNIHDQATIHEELLAELGITKCHIFAHDYGDTVAQEMLARFLEREKKGEEGLKIESMCFLNGGLFPETHIPRLIQKLLISPIGAMVAGLMNKARFTKRFSEVFGPQTQPSAQEIDDFWHLIDLNQGQKVGHKLIRYMKERKVYRERWVGALQKSTIPLRVIDGPFDPVSGEHMTVRYKELIPNPDVVLLDKGIGHYPHVEDPEGVLKAFLEFVGK